MPSDSHQHAGHQHPGQPSQAEAGAFSARWWEDHYRERDGAAGRVSPYLTGWLDHSARGTALDAGCGTGVDAIWLAARGWDVTAVDISATAVERARAAGAGADPPAAVDWVVADLTGWRPGRCFDLVISQYAHPDQPFEEFARRLAGLVADGGQLLIVGHDHADELSAAGAPRPAWIEAAGVAAVLDTEHWSVRTAGSLTRELVHPGGANQLLDTVVHARRTGPADRLAGR